MTVVSFRYSTTPIPPIYMKKLSILLMCASGLAFGSCNTSSTGDDDTTKGTASDHGQGTGTGTGTTTTGDYDGETSTAPFTDTLSNDSESGIDGTDTSQTGPDTNR